MLKMNITLCCPHILHFLLCRNGRFYFFSRLFNELDGKSFWSGINLTKYFFLLCANCVSVSSIDEFSIKFATHKWFSQFICGSHTFCFIITKYAKYIVIAIAPFDSHKFLIQTANHLNWNIGRWIYWTLLHIWLFFAIIIYGYFIPSFMVFQHCVWE